ncbi:hypothetical protein HGRIS_001136 [Hohenbuehelia grisea]|uniref:Uncharacterized protein n=1 Tax=Hohenbuehelia grisea TaxID=104357 RepID=A0ABR3JPM5_9AGAR
MINPTVFTPQAGADCIPLAPHDDKDYLIIDHSDDDLGVPVNPRTRSSPDQLDSFEVHAGPSTRQLIFRTTRGASAASAAPAASTLPLTGLGMSRLRKMHRQQIDAAEDAPIYVPSDDIQQFSDEPSATSKPPKGFVMKRVSTFKGMDKGKGKAEGPRLDLTAVSKKHGMKPKKLDVKVGAPRSQCFSFLTQGLIMRSKPAKIKLTFHEEGRGPPRILSFALDREIGSLEVPSSSVRGLFRG